MVAWATVVAAGLEKVEAKNAQVSILDNVVSGVLFVLTGFESMEMTEWWQGEADAIERKIFIYISPEDGAHDAMWCCMGKHQISSHGGSRSEEKDQGRSFWSFPRKARLGRVNKLALVALNSSSRSGAIEMLSSFLVPGPEVI